MYESYMKDSMLLDGEMCFAPGLTSSAISQNSIYPIYSQDVSTFREPSQQGELLCPIFDPAGQQGNRAALDCFADRHKICMMKLGMLLNTLNPALVDTERDTSPGEREAGGIFAVRPENAPQNASSLGSGPVVSMSPPVNSSCSQRLSQRRSSSEKDPQGAIPEQAAAQEGDSALSDYEQSKSTLIEHINEGANALDREEAFCIENLRRFQDFRRRRMGVGGRCSIM